MLLPTDITSSYKIPDTVGGLEPVSVLNVIKNWI